jgi:hypothetical protein
MIKKLAVIGLGAVITLAPLAALAQTEQLAQAVPAATRNSAHAGGGGSHGRHLRHRANTHKEQARAGAEHMRQMRMGTAPKS